MNWMYARTGDDMVLRLLDFEMATHRPPDIDAFHVVRSFDLLAMLRGHPERVYSPAIADGLWPLLAPDRPFDRLRYLALLWAVRTAGSVGAAEWPRDVPVLPATRIQAHSVETLRTIVSCSSSDMWTRSTGGRCNYWVGLGAGELAVTSDGVLSIGLDIGLRI